MTKSQLSAAMKADKQVVGNPALIALIPIVVDVITKLIGGCKKPQDALQAMDAPTPAQLAAIRRQARQQIRSVSGKAPKPAELDAVVDAALRQAKSADKAARVEFLRNSYQMV